MVQSWKEKRDYLASVIKKISEAYGGDDATELNDYINEVIKKYSSNMDIAIVCFEDVLARRPRCSVGNPPKPIGKIIMPYTASK